MNRGQFVLMLTLVAVAGLLGGVVSDWMRGAPAEAQGRRIGLRGGDPVLKIDPDDLKTLARAPFPEIKPHTPLEWAIGTISWISYDHESRTFCALMRLEDAGNILLRTKSTRVQSTLETAHAHDDEVTAEVVHQPGEAGLIGTYEARFIQARRVQK